jgi:diaminohydroxyphosphoribosylaminopyrimidine deaminase/5-amino-6-(5-phosphoribosylamino)uracil reductase
MSADSRFMRAALDLARRGLGRTAPNPAVGALVVREDKIIGRGWTADGGRPHAEPLALREAGEAARGATLYVTLEPCSHHGQTPPCTEAIVAAGIARVVVAIEDPDPRVAGRGISFLREAGIKVETGVCRAEARRAHLGHILRVTEGRPMVTLKLAETADGYAAGAQHDARLAITGAAVNAQVHVMRAMHDAVMVGIGTARADDPLMTVRLPGLEDCKPLRIVLDARLELSPRSRLAATAGDYPTLVLAGETVAASEIAAFREATAGQIEVTRTAVTAEGRIDLKSALRELGSRGLTRIFSEGGPIVGAGLIAQGFADEVILYTNAKPLGRPGVPALDAAARDALRDPARYRASGDALFGADRRRSYERCL